MKTTAAMDKAVTTAEFEGIFQQRKKWVFERVMAVKMSNHLGYVPG